MFLLFLNHNFRKLMALALSKSHITSFCFMESFLTFLPTDVPANLFATGLVDRFPLDPVIDLVAHIVPPSVEVQKPWFGQSSSFVI